MSARTILFMAAFASLLPAQEEASTLVLLGQQATAVVLADVLRSDPGTVTHETVFRTVSALKGEVTPHFSVREPAGACCGRALCGLLPGMRALLFLAECEGALHLCAGARGVAEPDLQTVQHVQRLLAAPGVAALPVLADGLSSPSLRVRRDAAMSLGNVATLPAADTTVRAAIVAAARGLLGNPTATTDLPYLVTAAARLQAVELLPDLVGCWVAGERRDLQGLVQTSLSRFPASSVVPAIAAAMTDEATRLRAIGLLAGLADASARAALVQVLRQEATPRVQLAACKALLARGATAQELGGLVPAAVLDAVRSTGPSRPKLRNVAPEASR